MNLRDSELCDPPGGAGHQGVGLGCQSVITSAPGSLETNKFPWPDSQWLLPY
jgi:hypothetical protein